MNIRRKNKGGCGTRRLTMILLRSRTRCVRNLVSHKVVISISRYFFIKLSLNVFQEKKILLEELSTLKREQENSEVRF